VNSESRGRERDKMSEECKEHDGFCPEDESKREKRFTVVSGLSIGQSGGWE